MTNREYARFLASREAKILEFFHERHRWHRRLLEDQRGFFQLAQQSTLLGSKRPQITVDGTIYDAKIGVVIALTTAGTKVVTVDSIIIVTAAGIAGGGGATYQTAGLDAYGGGGGSAGSFTTGTSVTLFPGVTYNFIVGAAGTNGVATGPAPTNGGSTFVRIASSTIYVELAGGNCGGAFTGAVFPGGAAVSGVTGSNLNNGPAGGNGGDAGGGPQNGQNAGGNGGGGGGTSDANGGSNAYFTGQASPGAGLGGAGASGGGPFGSNYGAGGGGAGGFVYAPTTTYAGYLSITIAAA